MTKAIPCDVYSRVVGYYTPVQNWNIGKKNEYKDRTTCDVSTMILIESDEGLTPEPKDGIVGSET